MTKQTLSKAEKKSLAKERDLQIRILAELEMIHGLLGDLVACGKIGIDEKEYYAERLKLKFINQEIYKIVYAKLKKKYL